MNSSKLDFFDNQYRWVAIFLITFAVSFYWLPEQIPLFYSQALPQEQLATKYHLLIIPLVVFIFFMISRVWLEHLALKNENMLKLIKYFRIGLAFFSYLLFFRIIFLII